MTENLNSILKVVAMLVAVVLLCVIMAGCATGSGSYVGTWQAPAPFGGITMVLNKDGTGIMSGGGDSANLTWKVQDGQIVIDAGKDGELTGQISDDKKSIQCQTEDGSSFIFIKQ